MYTSNTPETPETPEEWKRYHAEQERRRFIARMGKKIMILGSMGIVYGIFCSTIDIIDKYHAEGVKGIRSALYSSRKTIVFSPVIFITFGTSAMVVVDGLLKINDCAYKRIDKWIHDNELK